MITPLARSVALTAAALFLAGCSDTAKTPAKTKDAESPTKSTETKTSTSPAPAHTTPDGVKIACFGANACSGQTQCNVADGRFAAGSKGNACAGQNECKGKGWVLLDEAECATKGGKPL